MKTVIFTGGGSGGHVMPAITLIEELKKLEDYRVIYIGSSDNVESEIVPDKVDTYHPISTGKLRRYFSIQNFIDLFKISFGLLQSVFIMLKYSKKDTIVFGTGGFVSVAPIVAGWLTGKKCFIHEQTSRMGLANKICSKFSETVFVSFKQSLDYISPGKAKYSGYPIRPAFFSEPDVLCEALKENLDQLPILFVTGGGNGSALINKLIRDQIDSLTQSFFIVHQVGKQFIDEYQPLKGPNYHPMAFIGHEIIDLFKRADIVLSRSGAGTVCELMAIKKRSIFIPLKIAQKNEQYHNAMEAHKLLGSLVVTEDELKNEDTSIVNILKSFQENSTAGTDPRAATILDGRVYLTDYIKQVF
jgi:UDP-N-acetylglucosamine--N-acetylmuramyl-(pentapeptide) pyrophosphoryl-undecaprenol N-acetylglucosamine transferase